MQSVFRLDSHVSVYMQISPHPFVTAVPAQVAFHGLQHHHALCRHGYGDQAVAYDGHGLVGVVGQQVHQSLS